MANGTRLWVNTSGGRGRDIVIIADNVTLSASEISSSTIGSGDGGSIKIDAKGSLSISNISNVFSNTQPGFPSLEATGRGGDTVLNVGTLKLSGTSSINSGTSGAGRAGDVIINARESISLNRGSISSDTGRGFRRGDVTGDGGRIVISSPSLTMDNFSIITSDSFNSIGAGGEIMLNVGRLSLADLSGITSRVIAGVFPGDRGIGNGGTIQIIAKESLTISGVGGGIHATTFGEGKAGSIEIEVGRLTLTDGARIIADTSATGSAGTVKITATESIAISGRDKRTNSTGLISSQSEAGGDGGRVSISAPTLLINEGQISTATSGAGRAGDIVIEAKNATLTGGARVDSSTSGAGRGGDLTVTANSVSISGPGTGLFSTASGSGAGGNIRIQTGQLVRLSNEGTLSAQSTGTATATAGNININTPTFQSQNGSVTTGATSADGGNISITTTGSFVHLTDSQITTSVLSGAGSGGNIAIDSKLIVLNDSQILARAVRGHGGNINITGDVFLVNSGGRAPLSLSGIVDASSELSTPGTVNIEATFTNVTGSVTRLPETPLQATEPMRSSCAARSGGKASRLVIGGRDGLPLQPGDLLPSPLYLASEADIPDTPSTGNEVTRQDLSTRFSLLGPKDRSLNQYSLLPNAKCSL